MSAADNPVSPLERSRKPGAAAGWAICFTLAFALYAATANRGAQWQDSGYHILRVVTQEAVNPLGLALSHPLHHFLGRIAVWLGVVEPCFAVTLMSALAGAIAVANVFGVVTTLTESRAAAAFGAASLAFAHTFWQMSTLAETYTLAAALLSAECWCVVMLANQRQPNWVVAAFFFNGLGIANHMLAILSTPVLVAVTLLSSKFEVRSAKKGWGVGIGVWAAAAWTLGALPFLLLIYQEIQRSGDFSATVQSALFGHGYRGDVLNLSVSLWSLALVGAIVLMNFPNLLLPVSVVGARSPLIPLPARRALLAVAGIHAIFVLRYSVVDQHTFFVPMYAVLAMLGGVGFAAVASRPWGRLARGAAVALLIATPLFYAYLPSIARRYRVLEGRERHKPYRDDYVYAFTPWSVAENSADRMAREAVKLAGPDGLIVVEDRMASFAVKYRAMQAMESSIRVVGPDEITAMQSAAVDRKSVVFIPTRTGIAPPPFPGCRWIPEGEMFRLQCWATRIAPNN